MPQSALKDQRHEARLFLSRSIQVGILIAAATLVLIGRLVYLQVVEHAHFKTLSQDNRVRLEPLAPTRGLIYDTQGVLLAENLPAYSLQVIPEKVDNLKQTLAGLGQIIEITEDDLRRFEHLRHRRRRFEGIPLKVKLTPAEVARFAVNAHRFPAVEVRAALLRHYPHGDLTAHVLGYVGRIDERELRSIDASNYAGTSHIGKNGVEKEYEDILHGQVGLQQVEVNAKGRVLRVLENEPPVPGSNLRLAIDLRLQRAAMQALHGRNGAVAAIDPRNGNVLALVSEPSFDPNAFVMGISAQDYRSLRDSPDKPLFNRALRGQYPPGSTVKPFIGLGGLETGVETARDHIFCPGYYQLPGKEHKYRDWKRWGHGRVDLDKAITQSCDVYFYDLAHRMGIDRLHAWLDRFGFGQRTGIDLPGELGGLLPSRQWKRRRYHQVWFPGETLIMGIGQGYFLTTPLQLASATATLATGGHRLTPHVVRSIQGPNGGWVDIPPERREIPLNPRHWRKIVTAMTHVVEAPHGTARRIANQAYRIAAKTGTAQVFTVKQDERYDASTIHDKLKDHALFIAFAPVEAPRIAVAVVVEHGGHGGSAAAPVAKAVMDAWLLDAAH